MAKATTGAQVLGSEPAIEELIAEWKRSMKEGKDPFIIIPNGWDTPGEGRRKAGNKKILEAKQKRAQADAEKDVFKRKQLVEEADKLAAEGRKMGGSISREIDLELAQNIVANERILDARTAWLTADKRGDEVGKRKAEQEARDARKAGGTIPNCDLDEMKRMIGNQMILSSKIMWAEGHKDQDAAKKEQAEKLAAKGRAMGGTITSDDDLEDAQQMVANEMIWGAKQIWDDAQKTGGDASGAVASAKYAREKMGANITIDHSTEEAGRVVADNRSHAASKYSNSKGRAWNGMYNKADWENQAEQLYEQAGKPGGDKWAQDQLLLAEKILYGPPKEAESAKQKFDEAMRLVKETPASSGAVDQGYDTSGNQNQNPNDVYNHAKKLVGEINSIDKTKFEKGVLEKFVENYAKNKEIYERISKKTDIPPQLIAAFHYREATLDFGAYLHNGDKLGKPTVNYPAGKFFEDFEEAAVDALKDKKAVQKKYHINAKTNDLIALLAYAEEYNGLGNFNNNRVSSYVYSGTNVYKGGQYVEDHVYSSSAFDRRPGIYVLLKALEHSLPHNVKPSNPVDTKKTEQKKGEVKFESNVKSAKVIIDQDSILNQDAVYIPNVQNFPLYRQGDERYASEVLGGKYKMADSGCTTTSLAAVNTWKTYGKWKDGIEPHPGIYKKTVKYTENGDFIWGSVKLPGPGHVKSNGSDSEFISIVKKSIDKGNPILFAVNGGAHWMIIVGYKTKGEIIIFDPADGNIGTLAQLNKNHNYKTINRYLELQ
ncbi:C39 family peptidase [Paenibacillus elgii]